MGTSISSIHIFTREEIKIPHLEFQSFSHDWQTCVTDLSDKDDNYLLYTAKSISKQISAPVLYYFIFDSDCIYFHFFKNGKKIASYSDDKFLHNKNLYGIPSLVGYGDGYKKRLSNILSSSDAEEKTALLEEYFGVCLLPFSEFFPEPKILKRQKDDKLYNNFIEKEKTITGKHAPITAQLIAEYKGKLFFDYFGSHTQKEHYYLFGYDSDKSDLKPVRFCGERLEPISIEEFQENRTTKSTNDNFYNIAHKTSCIATFNNLAPAPYRQKSMTLPNGFFPRGFDTKDRLILDGRAKICIIDFDMKIISKISIKGDVADIIGDYILTASSNSFCGYFYDPKDTIRIYRLIEKK